MTVEPEGFAQQREVLLLSIEKDREDVRVAVLELTNAAESGFHMNDRIRTFPLAWALGAFLVGAWLGTRTPSIDAGPQGRPR